MPGKIYEELVLIRKELQAIRRSMESDAVDTEHMKTVILPKTKVIKRDGKCSRVPIDASSVIFETKEMEVRTCQK